MRTALCISGHLRTYQSTFESTYKNVILPTNADVFLHIWDEIGSSFDEKTLPMPSLDELNKLYNPKKIVIEPRRQFIDTFETQRTFKEGNVGVMSMYYKIQKANDLKSDYEREHNFTYDVVIRSRPDIYVDNLICKDELNDSTNYLYVPHVGADVWISDQFGFSSSKNMNHYAETYDLLPQLYIENNKILHPETMLKKCCMRYNIKVKESKIRTFCYRWNGMKESYYP